MSYADFLHCMTPYNNGELLEQSDIEDYLKDNTPEILKCADADGSGTINFTEFIFFLTLYQAPQPKIRKMCKANNKKFTKEQFIACINELRTRSSAGNKSKEKA